MGRHDIDNRRHCAVQLLAIQAPKVECRKIRKDAEYTHNDLVADPLEGVDDTL